MTRKKQSFSEIISIAPMLDWTDRHYRYMMRLITKHTTLYTEMIACPALILGRNKNLLLDYNPEEKFKSQLPFGTQLFVIGPKEVDFYNDKAAAERTDMSTENLGITRSIWK